MRLYIETSTVSFWYDTQPRNIDKRRAARRLLLLCRRGLHQASVSDIVLREIAQSKEPFRSRELRLIARLGLPVASYDLERYAPLVEAYQRHQTLSRLPEADLQHVAVFSASDFEGLVTYNLRHLANQLILNLVRSVNHEQGIDKVLRVAPPEAFLPPTET